MRSSRVATILAALAVGALTAGPSSPAHAQPGRPSSSSAPAPRPEVATSFREGFGIPLAVRRMASDDPGERIRGIVRLGSIGTPEAVDALIEQLDQGSAAGRDPRARLEAVRVLAAFTKKDNVRQLLTREATDTSVSEGRGVGAPLAALIRGTASLALARGGDKKAVGALVGALLQGNVATEAALRALRAYPPASLEAFLEGRKRLTPQLAGFLGELGDLRAIERLKAMLDEPDPAGQIAAGVALARLGDASVLTTARAWQKKTEPRFQRAAAEVLQALGAPDAAAAVAALFAQETTRDDALRLAQQSPSPEYAAPLLDALPSFTEAQRPRAIAAIGRAGGPKAIEGLLSLLARPDAALSAAHTLATMPGEGARQAIEKALADAAAPADRRRLLLRAGVLRALLRNDGPAGLTAMLEALDKGERGPDRSLATFGLVALGARSLADALERACTAKGCDAALVGAAARGALSGRPETLDALLPLLRREVARPPASTGDADAASSAERPTLLTEAAALALLAHPDGADLPTSRLAGWAESGAPLAALAARALPSRDDETLRARIKRLLDGSDPVVRAQVALGLARDPEPSAVSLLTQAYRFEDEPAVRRAIVRALSHRGEVQRKATLELARDLDPDDDVRALARAALDGRDLEPSLAPPGGLQMTPSAVWIAVVPNEGKARDQGARAARLTRADGLALPVVTDPDGALLVPGLPPGPVQLQLGPTPEAPPR